jgi:Zn-finger nucleic acid-binding protein
MNSPCKHPRVRVVSRQDDAEFVECELCREVFDSGEFEDMMIEEKQAAEADAPDAESA